MLNDSLKPLVKNFAYEIIKELAKKSPEIKSSFNKMAFKCLKEVEPQSFIRAGNYLMELSIPLIEEIYRPNRDYYNQMKREFKIIDNVENIIPNTLKHIEYFISFLNENLKHIDPKSLTLELIQNMEYIVSTVEKQFNFYLSLIEYTENAIDLENSSLSKEEIQKIWKIYYLDDITKTNLESDILFSYLMKDGDKRYDSFSSTILSKQNMEYLFKGILCSEKMIKPEKFSLLGFHCFKKYFYWYNLSNGRLSKTENGYVLISETLMGEEILWKIAANSNNKAVSEEAIELLIDLILNSIYRKNRSSKLLVIPRFINNCTEQLNQKNLNGIKMALKALDTIIDRTEFGQPETVNNKAYFESEPSTIFQITNYIESRITKHQFKETLTITELKSYFSDYYKIPKKRLLMLCNSTVLDNKYNDYTIAFLNKDSFI